MENIPAQAHLIEYLPKIDKDNINYSLLWYVNFFESI